MDKLNNIKGQSTELKEFSQTSSQIRSIDDVFSAKTPILSEIKKNQGDVGAEAVLVLLISNATNFFSVGKTMDDAGLEETARLILKEYYFLTLADFQLFFDNFKLGKYGESYNRIDGNVILVALAKYVKERFDIAEKKSIEAHKELMAGDESYFILKIGKYFIRETDEGFQEVETKILATTYDFKTAYKLQLKIQKFDSVVEKVAIVDSRKSEVSLFEFIKENKPELLTPAQKYHISTDDYFVKRNEIENSQLSELDKLNAIRALSNLDPLTLEESIQYSKIQTIQQ